MTIIHALALSRRVNHCPDLDRRCSRAAACGFESCPLSSTVNGRVTGRTTQSLPRSPRRKTTLRSRLQGDLGDFHPALAIGGAQGGNPHQHIGGLGSVMHRYAVVPRLQWRGWGQLDGVGQFGWGVGGRRADLHLGSCAGHVDRHGAQRGRFGQVQQQTHSFDEFREWDGVLIGNGGPRRVWVAVNRQVGLLRIVGGTVG